MASQRLIITKLGGCAAEAALHRFRCWAALRTSTDRHEWDANQWPAAIRREADDWFDQLRQNSLGPPVLFYSEYNDYWSFCPPTRFIGEDDETLLCVFGNRYEGFCAVLPLKSIVAANLEQVQESGQWAEDRIFARLTLHAARDWDELVEGGVLVFVRQVLRGAIDDCEIVESLKAVPDWMQIDGRNEVDKGDA